MNPRRKPFRWMLLQLVMDAPILARAGYGDVGEAAAELRPLRSGVVFPLP